MSSDRRSELPPYSITSEDYERGALPCQVQSLFDGRLYPGSKILPIEHVILYELRQLREEVQALRERLG